MLRMKALIFYLLVSKAWSQTILPDVLITSDDRIKNTVVLDSVDIKGDGETVLSDVLNKISGLEVTRQGGVGQQTSVFVRGSSSEDVLVMIDGIEVNDSSTPGRGFDFSTLLLSQVERIEIYKGPQSVRFGSGALAGVINIVTKTPNSFKVSSLLESGSYGTNKGVLNFSSGTNKYGALLNLESLTSDGISAASKERGNLEKDGASFKSLMFKSFYKPDSTSRLMGVFRYLDSALDLDRRGGVGGDDPNYASTSKQSIIGIQGQKHFLNRKLNSDVGVYYSKNHRSSGNQADDSSSQTSSDHFVSESKKVESNHQFAFDQTHRVQFHFQWKTEASQSESSFNGVFGRVPRKEQEVFGLGSTYQYDFGRWYSELGFRKDDYRASYIDSYRAMIGRRFLERSRLSVIYGTGYELPSLFQLYSEYGNSELKNEHARSIEVKLESEYGRNFTFSLSGFRNVFRNLIDFDMAQSKYFNVSSSESKGVELEGTYYASQNISIHAFHTYLETLDESTGQKLLRRPMHSSFLKFQYIKENLSLYLGGRFKGSRADIDPSTFERVKNKEHFIFDLGSSFQVNKNLKWSIRFENLFDQTYEEVYGYGTLGRSVYLSLEGGI